MANKFVLMSMAVLMALAALIAFAQAGECNGSGTTKLIAYSPSDLNVGEEFNLTYYDLFGGAGQLATLNYPPQLQRLSASDTVVLIDDGFGGGYFTWRMNSSAPGNHSVYVNISYDGSCNVTRVITIQSTLLPPQLELSYITPAGSFEAGEIIAMALQIANVGTGTAYNISGWTNFGSVIDQFGYSQLEAGNLTLRNFTVQTQACGVHSLSSVANYKDQFGYAYPPATIGREVEIKGSDLELLEFKVSNNEPKKGEKVEFKVKVTNNARSETINATNVVVKIYKGNDEIEEISLGNVDIGETVEGKGEWKASGSGKVELKAVVNADNECSNWNNNEISKKIKIKVKREEEKEEEIIPEPEAKKEEEEKPTTIPTTEEEEEKFEFPLALPLIALEAIVLVLLAIYAIRKRKRSALATFEPKKRRKK